MVTAAVDATAPTVTAPYVDASDGKLVVAFASALNRDGKLAGVVMGTVPMGAVLDNVRSVHPTPSSFAMLVDGEGVIVAHPDPKMTTKPLTDLFPGLSGNALRDLVGAQTTLDARAGTQAVLVRAFLVPGTNWTMIVALDKAEATAGMTSMVITSVIALFVIIAFGAAIMGLVTSVALKRLSSIRDAMDSIGSGTSDLTQRLPAHGNDEVAQIARAFNKFIEKLHDVMTAVRDSSESVRLASSEIAAGNLDLSDRTESAAASLQETTASVEEISATIANSTKSANEANVKAASAAATATAGGQVVNQAITMMMEIEHSSGKIGSIIGVIDGIAFQTNILALNAAVEATRAGEQGRGFAVVASEVRSLAARSAKAAKEIKILVGSTVSGVASGSGQVRSAGNTMDEIVGGVSNVSTIMAEITDAENEQTRGILEVNKAVAQLDRMVQQNAALVEQSAAAAAALQTQAVELAMAVGEFKLS
jgi:methyl-accepting chemotaxis protein